jgi:tetratricopeptide (TPR) repeat protein
MNLTRALSALVAMVLAFGALASPTSAQQIDEARVAFRTGRYEEAIDMFERLTRRDRSSVAASRGFSRALFDVGRYEDAADAARRFSRDNEDSPELQNSLGKALYAKGDLEEAEAAFERAVQGGASDAPLARLNLAVLSYERGERETAMEEFGRFIDVYNVGRDFTSEELTAVGTAIRYLRSDDWQYARDALRIYDEAIAADPANLDPRVEVGELFLEAYAGGEAAEAFEDVLQVNPSEPRALVGKARHLRFAGSPGAMETVQRSLEVNPNLVPARVFLAELLLELEEYKAAAQQIERALEVNPVSLEALSVMAATRFLQGDEAESEALRARVLELNPRYADLYVRLAETSARNRLYTKAVEFAQRAVELDERSWRGYAVLGVNELRVGAIDEGKGHLELAFENDPFDIWTKNTLDMLDTFEDYTEERNDLFIFVIDGKESELLSLYLADLAEEAYERLAEKYQYRAPTPIRVEVFRSHADFSVRTIGLIGLGALGVSFGPVIAMDSPSAREASEFNWGSTFWHELAHTFHLGLSDHRVPRWFSEGLAVHEERAARPGWGDDVSPSFLFAHLHEQLLPIGELNNGFARPTYPEQVIHSYYQASLVFDLIERDYGGQAIVAMLEGYRDGLSNEQVFEQVLATSVDEFNDVFFDYLEERFDGPLSALRPNLDLPPETFREGFQRGAELTDDPNNFLSQLGYGHSYVEQGSYDEAIPHLQRAKELFPEFAGSGSPYWYLALIHKEQGNLERAAAELAALTAINERDYQANLQLAEIREGLGDAAGAAEALKRTAYIYPFDMRLHVRLAELLSQSGDLQGVIRERRAVLALDPVDRAEAMYQLARAYYEAGELSSARRAILRVLEDAPSYEEAQELLLEIHARGGGTR